MSPSREASPAPLRIVFAGTPEFARLHLEAVISSDHTIVGAYTQPDRAAGRGKKLKPSPVKVFAGEHGIPVYQPASLRTSEALTALAALDADIMVVVAYGLLLPQAVLDTPRLGCINVHASLLPRWRGAAPIERAIAAGDGESGVTIMQMDAGLDTGPMLNRRSCPVDEHTSGDSLRLQLAQLGGPALLETLEQLAQGSSIAEAQDDSLATYAPKLQKVEGHIDWSMDSETIARKVRAFCSANLASCGLGEDRIKIWHAAACEGPQITAPGTILVAGKTGIEVACGKGALRITRLQLPGRKPLDAAAVLNARSAMFSPGTRLDG